jgi:hypothetical protein
MLWLTFFEFERELKDAKRQVMGRAMHFFGAHMRTLSIQCRTGHRFFFFFFFLGELAWFFKNYQLKIKPIGLVEMRNTSRLS